MSEDDEQPSPQSEALRQQQRSVAAAGSILAGLAVTIGLLQRYPDFVLVGVLAGIVSGLVVYRLAAASVFPAEAESTAAPASRTEDSQSGDEKGAEPANPASGSDGESSTATPNEDQSS
jgi:hypothetical protein